MMIKLCYPSSIMITYPFYLRKKEFFPAKKTTRRAVWSYVVLCLLLFAAGCEQAPKASGIFLIAKGYPPLKKYRFEEVVLSGENPQVLRKYYLSNADLWEAPAFSPGKRNFYIRQGQKAKEFKIIRVTKKLIIRYQYQNYQPIVEFNYIPGKLIMKGDIFLLETVLPPGKYLIVPWSGYLPVENYGYGFKIE